ncbi:MAG: hypothetical protein ACPGTS_01280, partial [Minisyncoccia bacterium]
MMPWLGSKAFMGIVSNPTQHQLLTDMVSNNFTRRDLVNKYIPKTIPVGKTTKDHVMNFYKDKKTILKANVSSGMKDIYTSEHTEFEKILLQSCNTKNTNYILQEMVDQKTFTFNVFNAQTGKLEVQNHYLRITGYIGADGSVLDAEVTGRQSPDVHGAPDCIMVPCSI